MRSNKYSATARSAYATPTDLKTVLCGRGAADFAAIKSLSKEMSFFAMTPRASGWLKSRYHLDLVGSFTPNMREADDDCMRGAFIAVDTLTALAESGDLSEPLARGVVAKGDISLLGELIAAKPATPRPDKTVFKAVGVAHADLAVAAQLIERNQQGD